MDFSKFLDDSYEIITGEALYKINGGNLVAGGANGGSFEQTKYGNQAYEAPKNDNTGGSTPTAPKGGEKGGNTSTTSTKTNNNQQGTPQNYNGPKEEEKTRRCGYVLDEDGAFGNGHAGLFVETEDGFSFFEVNSLPISTIELAKYKDKKFMKERLVLSIDDVQFPSPEFMKKINESSTAGVIRRDFKSRNDMYKYLKEAGKTGYDSIVEFKITEQQSKLLYNTAIEKGKDFYGYHLIDNSCGIWARDVLTTEGTGIDYFYPIYSPDPCGDKQHINNVFSCLYKLIAPNEIAQTLRHNNPESIEYRIQ